MKHIEEEHQRALIKWADIQRLNALHGYTGTIGQYLIHVPNGGKRNKREAGYLKAQGVRAGFPDLFLFLPAGPFHGLAIELKKPPASRDGAKAKPTTQQSAWLKKLNEQGYRAVICHGWHEAREEILSYLYDSNRKE